MNGMTQTSRMACLVLLLFSVVAGSRVLALDLEPRSDLHFPLEARATNKDGSLPTYKNAQASIEERVNDLLPRMTIEEKVSQMYVILILWRWRILFLTVSNDRIQGDMNGWMNFNDPLDNTHAFNASGLVGDVHQLGKKR